MVKFKIRKGDTVRVLRGRDRGKKGTVVTVMPGTGRLMVEGVHMVVSHVRPKRAQEKGQRVRVVAPLPISNVQLVCPHCAKGTRVHISRTGGKRVRRCAKCGVVIDT